MNAELPSCTGFGRLLVFTVNLLDRKRRLLVEHIDALRVAVAATRRDYPFKIDAFVVLPNHLHAVWTLPDGDADFWAGNSSADGDFGERA